MTIKKTPGSPYNRNAWTRGATRKAVIARDGGCVLCAQEGVLNCGSDGKGKGLVLGHVIPERLGGGSEPEDLVLLCPRHSGMLDGGRRYR